MVENTIKVTGKGRISAAPDMIRLILELEKTQESYEDTINASAAMTETLKQCFEQQGFSRKDVKTTSFTINPKYERYQDEHNIWKQRFVGYEFNHMMKVEFQIDHGLLGRLLMELSKCDGKPKFRLHFFVSDPDAVKNELLGRAVADSGVKAEVLAKASGAVLGAVHSIDYSWEQKEMVSRTMDRPIEMFRSADAAAIDIEPEDIEVTDTVTVIWRLLR